MPPEAWFPIAAFAIAVLLRLAFGRSVAPPDPDQQARLLLETLVGENLESLSRAWQRCAEEHAPEGGEAPRGFAEVVELFIGAVVMSEIPEDTDQELRQAVIEMVTLEREAVYALITARVRDHLPSLATSP